MKSHMVSNEIPITFCAFESTNAELLGTASTWSLGRPLQTLETKVKNMQIALEEMLAV